MHGLRTLVYQGMDISFSFWGDVLAHQGPIFHENLNAMLYA